VPNWPIEFLRYLHSIAVETFLLVSAVLGFWRAVKWETHLDRESNSSKPKRRSRTGDRINVRPPQKGVRRRPRGS
jgi:hypothetical protein